MRQFRGVGQSGIDVLDPGPRAIAEAAGCGRHKDHRHRSRKRGRGEQGGRFNPGLSEGYVLHSRERSRRLSGYTGRMEFEWDPGKAAGNLRKHKVSFTEAATVFGDFPGTTALPLVLELRKVGSRARA